VHCLLRFALLISVGFPDLRSESLSTHALEILSRLRNHCLVIAADGGSKITPALARRRCDWSRRRGSGELLRRLVFTLRLHCWLRKWRLLSALLLRWCRF
jgi:hypothetical protein